MQKLKGFAKKSSANIKLSKTQISKITQSGPLLKTGLPLMRNLLQPLAKSVLIPLGLIAAASSADPGMHKKVLGSGSTTLIISNEEMEDIMKIVKPAGDSGLLIEGVRERIQN